MTIRIITNYNCNLGCSYCFEQHLWNKKEVITSEELKDILDFYKNIDNEVMLLGGEPTLHPQFLKLVAVLKSYPKNINYLLTNGIFSPAYQDAIIENFKLILININEPSKYSKTNWTILEENLKVLAQDTGGVKVQLGVNLYDKNQRLEYLIPFFTGFQLFKELRVAFANPNHCFTNNYVDLAKMKEIAPLFMGLVAMAHFYGFTIKADCPIPLCVFSSDDLKNVGNYISNFNFASCKGAYTFFPGLKVGHCFASFPDLYDFKSFRNIEELEYKILEKESQLDTIASFSECEKCFFWQQKVCKGVCLAYKIKIMNQMKNEK
ncbi:MAG: radical SAM protein [Candidatus Margulisiibacteriota bacterium]|jgi:hypothetical protein